MTAVKVWYDADNGATFDPNYDLLIGSDIFYNTGQQLLSKITFNTDKVQRIITNTRAYNSHLSQLYFITFDIADDAVPVDPVTNQQRTLGAYLTAESFPVDPDIIPNEDGECISEPNTISTVTFPAYSVLRPIVSSPRRVYIKSTPVFSDDETKPAGNLYTYNVPKLESNIDAVQEELTLVSDDPNAISNPALAFPVSGYIMIDNEIIGYSAKSQNALAGLQRGILNSMPASHNAGSLIGLQVTQGATNYAVQKLEIWCDGYHVQMSSIIFGRVQATGLHGSDTDILAIKVFRDMNGNGMLDRMAIESFKGTITVDKQVGSGRFSNWGAIAEAGIGLNDPSLNRGYVLVNTIPTIYFVTFDVSPSAKFCHPGISNLNEVIGGIILDNTKIKVNHPSQSLQHTISTYVPSGAAVFPITTTNMPIVATVDTLELTPEDKTAPVAEQLAENFPMLRFTLRSDKNTSIWQAIKVDLTGLCVDADVRRVKVWKALSNPSEYSQYSSTTAIGSEVCGLISIGTDRFVERTVNITLMKQQAIGVTTVGYYVTFDIDPFATVGNTIGAKIDSAEYLTVQVPDRIVMDKSVTTLPFTTRLASVGEVMSLVAVSMYDSAKELQLSIQGGIYQSEQKAGIMRLSLRTDKAEAYWTAIQVERTGLSSEALFPEGRNSDVKYIKIYSDKDFSGTLTAPDVCISETETVISSFIVNGICYDYINGQDNPPFDIIVESTMTETGTFPGSGLQMWLKAGEELMVYTVAGTTLTSFGNKPYLHITERGRFNTPKTTIYSGTKIKKVDMFDLSDNRNKLKAITLTTVQRLRPNSQAYFIAYDIGDNARGGNSVGISIADKNWIGVKAPSDIAHELTIEPSMQVKTFDDCKSSLVSILPLQLRARSENLAPLSTKQNTKNVPLMKLVMQTNINTISLSSITLTQSGTITDTTSPLGKGQGDFSTLSIWRDKPTAILPGGDGLFDPLNDLLVSTINHSTALSPNVNFINGQATLFMGQNGITISTQPVTLFVTANIGRIDLAGQSTEDDLVGIKLSQFGGLAMIPQTAVTNANNSFPMSSNELHVLNEYTVVSIPWAPVIKIKADMSDGYPAMDTNGDGIINQADRVYRDNRVFLDWNNDGVNDLKDLDADGVQDELDLLGDGLQAIDIDGNGYLDIDMNYDGVADTIVPDNNGDGIPEIYFSGIPSGAVYVPVRWANSTAELTCKWSYSQGASSYLFAIGKGPDDISISGQWYETTQLEYSAKGLVLSEYKYTKLMNSIDENDMPVAENQGNLKVYVESVSGFEPSSAGYIYAGDDIVNTEIMRYSGMGSEEGQSGLRYFFNVAERAALGTTKKVHIAGTTVSNAQYYCKVKAKNSDGIPGPETVSAVYRIDSDVPVMPNNIIARSAPDSGEYNMTIIWEYPVANMAATKPLNKIYSYEVQEKGVNTGLRWKTIAVLPKTKTVLQVKRPAGQYNYRVRSQDIAGNRSSWSEATKMTAGISTTELENVYVYPNPYAPNDWENSNGIAYSQSNEDSGLIFDNIPDNMQIDVYSVSGGLLFGKRLENSGGRFRWDIKDNKGNELESGGYIAVLTVPDGKKKTFKIGIIK